MRIGITIGAYHTRGGLERVAVETARGLANRGHTVVVVTQDVGVEPRHDGVDIIRVGGVRRNRTMRALTFPFAATRAVRDLDLDVVYAFGSSVLAPAVVRAPGVHRSWWTLANTEWPAATSDGLRRRLNPFHRVTLAMDALVLGRGMPLAVLAAGGWAADEIRDFYPRVADRVQILPDGVNLDEFDFRKDARDVLRVSWGVGDGPVLLSVATELRRKGLDTLFEAFRSVAEQLPQATLIVGGRAPASDIRALAVASGVEHGVRAIGEIPDMAAAYSAADVLIFPTRFDPWGLPVVESLACGTPVAVSARAGASLSIIPGENGALISEPTDPRQVADATIAALFCETPRSGIRDSITDLDWSHVVKILEGYLTEAAAR